MTTRDPIDDGHDTDAKLSLQRRQQLSALVDGELALDQARFLARRLGHDAELAGRWGRWHLVGDVLRGQPVAALPAGADGFAARVAAALAAAPAPAVPVPRSRWRHGLGMALAASVAAVALFVARPLSVDGDVPVVVATEATAPIATPVPTAANPSPSTAGPVREVSVPQFADAPPQAPATRQATTPSRPAAGPRRVASVPVESTGTLPGVPAPDALPGAEASVPPAVLVAAQDLRPFASPREPPARPWPRAVLPGLSADGDAFTVGLDDTAEAPSFYPFEPQLPVEPERTP